MSNDYTAVSARDTWGGTSAGPRERLRELGRRSLKDEELIALLLRTGTRGSSAVDLAGRLLERAGGLGGLARADPRELRMPGLGSAKLGSVMAAVELASRLAHAEMSPRRRLENPDAVARYLSLRYAHRQQETMGALYLDTRKRLLEEREHFRGTLDRASVCPSLIVRGALLCSAAGVLAFHNHPSGDPSPSPEDLRFTRRLSDSCDLLGLVLVDHLILGGGGRYLSLRERGGW